MRFKVTEALRIYLAYLNDRKRMAQAHSNAFTDHWLPFEEFEQLEELVLKLCDEIDAYNRTVSQTGDVCT
jgi:HPt (histidine-containing phosphotransfer) domain-containing protein